MVKEINASKEVATIEKELMPLVLKAGKLEITNAKEQEAAGKLLTQLQGYAKRLRARKEEITKPMNAALKSARDLFKAPEEKALDAIEAIRGGMGAFQLAEEKRAKAQEQKIADRVGEGRGHYTAETASKKMAEIATPRAVVNEGGMIKFRTDKKLKITDWEKLRTYIFAERLFDFVEFDEAAILEHLKDGYDMPGAEIIEVKTPITTLAV